MTRTLLNALLSLTVLAGGLSLLTPRELHATTAACCMTNSGFGCCVRTGAHCWADATSCGCTTECLQ